MYDALYARQSIEKKDSISVESQLEYCRYETHGEACIAFRQACKAKAALYKGIGFQSNTF